MYDVGTFFGFVGFLLVPCAITILAHSRREKEDVRIGTRRIRSSTQSNAIFIAPVRREPVFQSARAK